MYSTAMVVMHMVYFVVTAWTLQDIIENTKSMLTMIQDILRERTRLPADIVDNLHSRRVILTAEQCLEYGLVDAVLPSHGGGGRQVLTKV